MKLKKSLTNIVFAGAVFIAGCGGISNDWELGESCSTPKWRKGYYASATAGTKFLGLEDLGNHSFDEGNGQVYTCKAGHIDIAHVRKIADWTAKLSQESYKNLIKGKRGFSFKTVEPDVYEVELDYPDDWRRLNKNKREKIAKDVAIDMGEYFSYTGGVWHEMLTWEGYKIIGVWSEFQSAFSWEDTFSNALGSKIGGEALRKEGRFNRNVTQLMKYKLLSLGILSKRSAREISKEVKGDYWTGGTYFFVDIKKRNLDIGGDGFVSPVIVKRFGNCYDSEIFSCPVPEGDISKYGFDMRLKINPKCNAGNKLADIVYREEINPKKDFPKIMDYIKRSCYSRGLSCVK